MLNKGFLKSDVIAKILYLIANEAISVFISMRLPRCGIYPEFIEGLLAMTEKKVIPYLIRPGTKRYVSYTIS